FLRRIYFFLAAAFFEAVFFLGAFFSIKSFTSSNVNFEASTVLGNSIFVLPFIMLCLPHLAFSTLMPSSFQLCTTLSFSFWILSSISSSISESDKLSQSYFLFTLMNMLFHLIKGPKRPLPFCTGKFL